MSTVPAPRVVVASVGCELHRDDGAGPAVLARARDRLDEVDVLGPLATPLHLIGAWDGADVAIVVDAVSGGEPGTVRVVELDLASPPEAAARAVPGSGTSSHGFGVIDAVRLANVLGSAPARVVLIGVTGEDFGAGLGLSPPVRSAVERAAGLVVELARPTATAAP